MGRWLGREMTSRIGTGFAVDTMTLANLLPFPVCSYQLNWWRFQGNVSGTQVRQQVRGRSKFGLGFALTHTQIKSDDSHQKSTSLSIHLHFPVRNGYRINSVELPRLRFW